MTVPVPPPPSAGHDGPRRPRRPRAALGAALAALAALVVLGGAVAVVLTLRDGGAPATGEAPPAPAATPTGTETATPPEEAEPSPEPTAAQPSPAPTGPDDVAEWASPLPGERPEGLDDIAEQVAALRGLPAGDPLDARVVSPDDLGAKLTGLAFAEYEEGELESDGRLLAALRLLDEGHDLQATIADLYRAQILGLYVVEEQVLYIGGQGARLTPAQRITAAHEVLHALQDRAFDLEAFMDLDDGESDAQLARLALVEGDAVVIQQLWSLEHQSAQEREQAHQESMQQSPDALLAAPEYVRESLLFPYTHGARFVETLVVEGGFGALDAAFADPPASTRHILRPQTYLDGEEHTGTTVTTIPGDGWEEASAYTFGEFDVDHWLAPLGQDRLAVTAGWDGGHTVHWERGDDDAVALALRLSTAEAAGAACAAAPAWYAAVAGGEDSGSGLQRGDRDWMAYTCGDTEVLLGIGPDAATAERLAGR